jgi:hypothetical protein
LWSSDWVCFVRARRTGSPVPELWIPVLETAWTDAGPNPRTTTLGIPRLLIDDRFRELVVRRVRDPVVRQFWREEYAIYSESLRQEAIARIQNTGTLRATSCSEAGHAGRIRTSNSRPERHRRLRQ